MTTPQEDYDNANDHLTKKEAELADAQRKLHIAGERINRLEYIQRYLTDYPTAEDQQLLDLFINTLIDAGYAIPALTIAARPNVSVRDFKDLAKQITKHVQREQERQNRRR